MRKRLVIDLRLLAVVAVGVLAFAGATEAQNLSSYRTFVLGSDMPTVAKIGGLRVVDARVVHSRPALIQGLEWRPPFVLGSTGRPADPVQLVEFAFYDGQLFRMTVAYDRDKVEGMTNEDLIAAVSVVYGTPMLPTLQTRTAPAPDPVGWRDSVPIAEWDAEDARVTLSRGTFPALVRLVLISKRLNDLAQSSVAESVRLDKEQAPQRDADRRKKEQADTAAAQDKARESNKAGFRP
jgi:hypothetical protein